MKLCLLRRGNDLQLLTSTAATDRANAVGLNGIRFCVLLMNANAREILQLFWEVFLGEAHGHQWKQLRAIFVCTRNLNVNCSIPWEQKHLAKAGEINTLL